jgi:hypothetical protein
MKLLPYALILTGLLIGCNFKMPGDTTAAPTAGKTYWVNKANTGCMIATAAGEVVVAGPFATMDNAKRARASSPDCQ